MSPKSDDQCPCNSKAERNVRQTEKEKTPRGEGDVKTEAEMGLMGLQAKDCRGVSAGPGSYERGMEGILSQGLGRRCGLPTLCFQPSAPRL